MSSLIWIPLCLSLIATTGGCLPTVANGTSPPVVDESLPLFSTIITGGTKKVYWPLSFVLDGNYVSKSSGRHRIQFNVPPGIARENYTVGLGFYFDGLSSKPSIRFEACNQTKDHIEDDFDWTVEDGLSFRHEHSFDPSEVCAEAENKNITYNIELHDKDDLFGWNYLMVYPTKSNGSSLDYFLKWQAGGAYLCNLRACDTSLFSFSNFERVHVGEDGGLGPTKKQRYLLDYDTPLRLSVESANFDPTKHDACFDVSTFVYSKTKLKLLATGVEADRRQLKTLSGPPEGLGGKWYSYEYCLGDHAPPLARHTHTYSFLFMAEKDSSKDEAAKPILILSTRNSMKLSKPKPMVNYLPNVSRLNALSDYWTFDSNSNLTFAYHVVEHSPRLNIGQINSTSSEFVLTSRWIDAGAWNRSEAGIRPKFYYETGPTSWVERVEVECQYSINGSIKSATSKVSVAAEGIAIKYELGGLAMEAFRIVLRHQISPIAKPGHSLTIDRLSFGDVCTSKQKQCSGGGECEPTGFMEARCRCDGGYYGDLCEKWSPCGLVQDGGLDGHQLCERSHAGATCDLGRQKLSCLKSDGTRFDPFELSEAREQPDGTGKATEKTQPNPREEDKASGMGIVVPLMLVMLLVIVIAAAKWRKRYHQFGPTSRGYLLSRDSSVSLWA